MTISTFEPAPDLDFKLLCVTNRKLAGEGFLPQIAKIAPFADAIILREKDLTEEEYSTLARQVIAAAKGTPVILHTFVRCAIELGATAIHLPFDKFMSISKAERAKFSCIGVSCHSVEEATKAEAGGAGYLTAGHIFETDCKKGMPGRCISFLRDVCAAVKLPVFAIGGIRSGNVQLVKEAGARGACVMSGAMQCLSPEEYIGRLR